MGLVDFVGIHGGRCSMIDQGGCDMPKDEQDTFDVLMKNFNYHYKTNRAPYGLYLHANWFSHGYTFTAMDRFLKNISQQGDVYILRAQQTLEWMRNPMPLSRVRHWSPWQCPARPGPEPCSAEKASSCKYPAPNITHNHDDHWMTTCNKCPKHYPWIYNPDGH
eukprot:NODE_1213_length_646_cov_750.194305_g952_i0.p1 GENE.NODE_1213_length_646_cov_750.194305_g952_i0~~NODE_1213_length_646_cov_750.194305_g952_i0.p1  ORF type:complete len:173 (+),score=16.91 NODE_1213_length_646_cov_750.194305_g952_i0:32-520(+)